jgi:hypothetical protein
MRWIALEVMLRAVFRVDDVARNAPLCRARANAGGHDGPPGASSACSLLSASLPPCAEAAREPAHCDASTGCCSLRSARRRNDLGGANRDGILSLLISACDDRGEPLSDDHLRDELLTMFVAGHETTATALAWASRSRAVPPRSTASRRSWTRARTPT